MIATGLRIKASDLNIPSKELSKIGVLESDNLEVFISTEDNTIVLNKYYKDYETIINAAYAGLVEDIDNTEVRMNIAEKLDEVRKEMEKYYE